MKNKRVLWICNHTTLMEFECDLLKDLGYEIFVPKVVPNNDSVNYRTATANFSYDDTLTIPKEDLELLNNFSFYDTYPTKEISNILNKYFGICFCVTIYPAITNIAQIFKGKRDLERKF